MTDFDVIVVGGGPAGASAAIHLASGGARVLLAEQKRFPRAKLCGEFITPECLGHFARLGVSCEMEGAGGAPVSETVFYAGSGRGVRVPSEWFGGGGACALGLSRAAMDDLLLERARACGVEVMEDAAAAGLLLEDGARGEQGGVRGVRLNAGGGERSYTSRVALDATGRGRVLTRLFERAAPRDTRGRAGGASAGAMRRAPLVAFKAHLEGARGARATCEIYFYRGGYGGLSPVEGGLSNLCFIARARDVRRCGSDPERVLREVVLATNERAARALAGARARSGWLSVALESFGRRDPVPAEGLLAVGDAAAFIDPFTGSGMLMALESGETAARAVSRWLGASDTSGASGGGVRPGRADFADLARDYRALYAERFDARLRLCGLLRRAAFAPRTLTEAFVLALGASEGLRRRVARATRRAA